MRYGIEMQGDKRAARTLHKIAAKAVHASPILEQIGEDVLDIQAKRFKSHRFKPLSSSTRARKARQGLPRRPLMATGALRTSVTKRGGMNIFVADSKQVTIGSRVSYAYIHRYGVGLPKRDPLAITPKQRRTLAAKILRWLTGQE